MSYFLTLAISALTLFALLFVSGRMANVERGKNLFLLLCLVPTILMFLIGLVVLNLPVEGATKITVENIDRVPDPGPVSFARAMSYGFIPAVVYFLVSCVGYLLSGLVFRK